MFRALVVDDSPTVRDICTRVLKALDPDLCVLAAENGYAALSITDIEGLPDLLIVDHQMPGMDGPELLRTLRGRRFSGAALLITSLPISAFGAEIRGSDDNKYIQKPQPKGGAGDVDRFHNDLRYYARLGLLRAVNGSSPWNH